MEFSAYYNVRAVHAQNNKSNQLKAQRSVRLEFPFGFHFIVSNSGLFQWMNKIMKNDTIGCTKVNLEAFCRISLFLEDAENEFILILF